MEIPSQERIPRATDRGGQLDALRGLLRAETTDEVVAILVRYVHFGGGKAVPASDAPSHALPLDLALGEGDPLLPVFPAGSTAVVPLAGLVEDAREAIHRIRRHQRTMEDATTDLLTGVMNRRSMGRILARAYPTDCVCMLDLDHFKALNDSQGHAAGDALLRSFGRCLRVTARADDRVARYGGEEFLLLLRETDTDGAIILLERVRERWLEMRSHPLTFSAGIAQVGLRAVADALAAADAALYRAKQSGRDRIDAE